MKPRLIEADWTQQEDGRWRLSAAAGHECPDLENSEFYALLRNQASDPQPVVELRDAYLLWYRGNLWLAGKEALRPQDNDRPIQVEDVKEVLDAAESAQPASNRSSVTIHHRRSGSWIDRLDGFLSSKEGLFGLAVALIAPVVLSTIFVASLLAFLSTLGLALFGLVLLYVVSN